MLPLSVMNPVCGVLQYMVYLPVKWGNNMIYPVYAEKDNMTFVMKEEGNTIEVVGFYFGEPSEELTREYKNNLVAVIEK